MYVKELDIFLTMKVLDNTPGTICRSESFAMKTGIPTKWISGQKTTSRSRRNSDNLQHRELRSYRGSRLVKFFLDVFINFTDIL